MPILPLIYKIYLKFSKFTYTGCVNIVLRCLLQFSTFLDILALHHLYSGISLLHYLVPKRRSSCRNYVVQFVLEHGTPSSRRLILNSLRGHHVTLSMQKYASNVVEKCLVYGGPDNYGEIVQELIRNPRFSLIAEDQYGNYVVQTALAESKVKKKTFPTLIGLTGVLWSLNLL